MINLFSNKALASEAVREMLTHSDFDPAQVGDRRAKERG